MRSGAVAALTWIRTIFGHATSYSDFGGTFFHHIDASVSNTEETCSSNNQQICTKLQGIISHNTSIFSSTSDRRAQCQGISGSGGRVEVEFYAFFTSQLVEILLSFMPQPLFSR